MTEGSESQNFLRRYGWIIGVLLLIFVCLCAFVGPGRPILDNLIKQGGGGTQEPTLPPTEPSTQTTQVTCRCDGTTEFCTDGKTTKDSPNCPAASQQPSEEATTPPPGTCECQGTTMVCGGESTPNAPRCLPVTCKCDGTTNYCSNGKSTPNAPQCAQVTCTCQGPDNVCSNGKSTPNAPQCAQATCPPGSTDPACQPVVPSCGNGCSPNEPAAPGWFCDNGRWNSTVCDKNPKPPPCTNPYGC